MKFPKALSILYTLLIYACTDSTPVSPTPEPVKHRPEIPVVKPLEPKDITLSKNLEYDKYTLDDVYPYRDTTRSFKWETIKQHLADIENMQSDKMRWAVMTNYKNRNGEAPLVKTFVRNEYTRVSDTLGVERYQSVPVYELTDTVTPLRYGRDGSIVWLNDTTGNFWRIQPVNSGKEWLVPRRYLKHLPGKVEFSHVIVVDRGNQNITTLERKSRGKWDILSMNPATTGRHAPPYAQETPLGVFLLQEKKKRMLFLKDGSTELGGEAPFASRFTNGAYIHGIPTNLPQTGIIEYSWSLGTVPKSHMCVRNATSHAQFIYEWAPTERTLIVVIE